MSFVDDLKLSDHGKQCVADLLTAAKRGDFYHVETLATLAIHRAEVGEKLFREILQNPSLLDDSQQQEGA